MPVKQSGGHNPTPHEAGSSTPFWTNRIKLNTFVYTFVLLAFCLPVIALTLVLKIPSWYGARAAHWASAFTHCDFKGHFTPYDKPSISIWDKSGLFYINVAWGSMAFSTAKFIDVVWDIVVGRAGQAFLGWVTYKVSSQYLAMAMREAPVSYTTYVSLAFVPPNLTMTARLAGELLTNRGWRPRLIMVWIVLSSLFVLSFSTFVAAMSGYSSNSYAVLANHAGEVVPWDNFPVVQFAINDAWRMGEPGPVTITMGETCTQQGLKDDDSKGISQSYHRRDNQGEDGDGGKGDEQPWQYVPFNCTMFWRTVQYVSSYGLHGTQIQASTFTLNGLAHNLSSPTLNITTSYTPSSLSKLTGYLANYSMQSPKVLKDVNEISESTFWTYENETYSLAYVLDRASCQYSRSHNWGFSFLLLFITSLLLALWAGGTCALWLHVHRKDLTNMHVLRDRHLSSGPSGIFRSSWDLSEKDKASATPAKGKQRSNFQLKQVPTQKRAFAVLSLTTGPDGRQPVRDYSLASHFS
ncbi:hypothetical protein A1O3_02788 [Capronia epimyces CBS 606.96]|uniref:Uncharacterized protein n=1 Tax=Capronia epimyces CBS 606.96 TaxID=1182542 RepID=W9YKE2_9EURO|nr:uncharacterized protein A1O3_02788 [Capronia epimyces CBS 606.96]EXJ89721.1 hypothetical protein A1O3_02788 [Capronia epimyces CBS 606.96]